MSDSKNIVKNVVDTRVKDLIFDYVDKTYFHCNKRSLNSGRSYAQSCDWHNNEKAAINPEKYQ